ncbi:MAG: hypothetical protein V1753_06030 [Pseudomonadota bacterium]
MQDVIVDSEGEDKASDYDSPWKEAIECYFEAFMEFFFPDLLKEIDLGYGYEFLDKELQKIVSETNTGRRAVDKLIKVVLKGGSERLLLIHIEVQASREPLFAERMFIYYYRVFDRYREEVISLAILADSDQQWRPAEYKKEIGGCKLHFVFPIVKLIDYLTDWSFLETTINPFGLIVMAHLKALITQKGSTERYDWKLSITKRLYKKGYSKDDIWNLYRFIDWIMVLPEELSRKFNDEIVKYEEEEKMPHITTAERIGIEKGILQGIQQGIQQGVLQGIQQGIIQKAQEAVVDTLEVRFDVVPQSITKRLKSICDPAILKTLHRKAIEASSVEEFVKAFDIIEK